MCLDVCVFLSVCLDQVIRMCIQLRAVYLRGGDDDSVTVDSHYTA